MIASTRWQRLALGLLALTLTAALFALAPASSRAQRFDNGQWVIAKGTAAIPEAPFKTSVDGVSTGSARLLTFASRVGGSNRLPQVLVISASGYLRMKPGADPSPPLPFGQSLVLGPAVFGTSSRFPASTLFFNPQIQQVNVDTSRLRRNGRGALLIEVVARDDGLPATDTHTNQVMDLSWKLTLAEPTNSKTQLSVNGRYRFTEPVTPDPVRSSELQSFRLVQVSSMFIDAGRHDVTGLRYRSASGPVALAYSPSQANALLPATPSALLGSNPTLESIDSDDTALPNGNAPSYRIRMEAAIGPLSGPLIPRAYFNSSQDLNDDNLGLWIYRRPATTIPAGARGRIRFKLTATADPLPFRGARGD